MVKYKSLLNSKRIAEHTTSEQEITELFAVAERDIVDAGIKNLSDDRAYATAYNAALQLCTIIMAIEGYRTRGTAHHRTTFDFLEAAEIEHLSEYAAFFNKCRRKRNDVDYDRAMVVSSTERNELLEVVQEFMALVRSWVNKE